MNYPLRNPVLFLVVLSIFIMSCQSNPNKVDSIENIRPEIIESELNADEEEIKASIEKLLFAAGNYNIEELVDMVSDKAMIGYSSLRDGVWFNKELSIDEYFANAKNRKPRPFNEIVSDYTFLVTEGRMALVKADAIVYKLGIPGAREINHFTLMKENENWKFLNISWTAIRIEEENRIYDVDIFARSYAQAWCSKRPDFVAMYFTENGSLQVNDGDPANGRDAISKVAQGFMTDLPDMMVHFDSLVTKSNATEFYWTLIATNSGPGGTGNKVKLSGYELWQLDSLGLIKSSLGRFPTEEYTRQLEFGIDN